MTASSSPGELLVLLTSVYTPHTVEPVNKMSLSEKKAALPTTIPVIRSRNANSVRNRLIAITLILISLNFAGPLIDRLFPLLGCHHNHHAHIKYSSEELDAAKCPAQPKPLNVGTDWNPLTDETYTSLAAKRLSKSVQIRTESYDDLPLNASDPAWDKHDAFSHFLQVEFPKVFNDPIKHEVVNVHGHLFTWEGSNPDLQPIMLMAHTDTVPVLPETLSQWTYPPFEGRVVVDGTPETPGAWVWGRGSSDCKNALMGIYGAMERLVTEGFKPERTILVVNGFDEEVSDPTSKWPAELTVWI